MAKTVENSVHHTLYLRNHTSYDLHLWLTLVMVSSGVFFFFFFHFSQVLIFWVISRVKKQKMAQNDKKVVCHILYLMKHKLYDHDF